MTPQQKLKHAILLKAVEFECITLDDCPEITAENVDDIYDEKGQDWALQDAKIEIRYGGVETNIAAPASRHYEARSVAMQMPDGSWVGWTYWYGGGKHGEPEAVPWMEDAYDLTYEEKQVTVTQRTFSKVSTEAP